MSKKSLIKDRFVSFLVLFIIFSGIGGCSLLANYLLEPPNNYEEARFMLFLQGKFVLD